MPLRNVEGEKGFSLFSEIFLLISPNLLFAFPNVILYNHLIQFTLQQICKIHFQPPEAPSPLSVFLTFSVGHVCVCIDHGENRFDVTEENCSASYCPI